LILDFSQEQQIKFTPQSRANCARFP
jgi:hypothetical protein